MMISLTKIIGEHFKGSQRISIKRKDSKVQMKKKKTVLFVKKIKVH